VLGAPFAVLFDHALDASRLPFTAQTIITELTRRAICLGNTLARDIRFTAIATG
jgi:hypothetical protein